MLLLALREWLIGFYQGLTEPREAPLPPRPANRDFIIRKRRPMKEEFLENVGKLSNDPDLAAKLKAVINSDQSELTVSEITAANEAILETLTNPQHQQRQQQQQRQYGQYGQQGSGQAPPTSSEPQDITNMKPVDHSAQAVEHEESAESRQQRERRGSNEGSE